MKKILLLSGYDAASHRYWRTILEQQLADYEWTQIAMPDRHFAWRVRGNSMGFAFTHREELKQHYDLLVVTSMVDLSSLIGFCPNLGNIPTIVYFHDNQFAYPVDKEHKNLVNIQLTSIYTALCADTLLFNSQYNQDTFIQGCQNLLSRLPDQVPPGLTEKLQSIAEVLPVPMATDVTKAAKQTQQTNVVPEIVWNHRWEYDKQPDVFFNALKLLRAKEIDFKLHVLGQSFRNSPDCFNDIETEFAGQLLHKGYLPREEYLQVLARSDIVVSSALHDFQGLSIQEGITLGCLPVAPNRVAYPEYIPLNYLYEVSDDRVEESHSLFDKLKKVLLTMPKECTELAGYQIEYLMPRYQQVFDNLLSK